MQDDLDFGTAIWASSSDIKRLSAPVSIPLQADDGFGGFNTSVKDTQAASDVDDFGDFGEFGDGHEGVDMADFDEEIAFDEDVRIPAPVEADWEPLRLRPSPSRSELYKQVSDILGPIWADDDLSQVTTDEEIREVEGISRILMTPESRELYKLVADAPPIIKPINWTRSRIRRQHLIALQIPVNLDEVLPHANGKLPPLQISTKPASSLPVPHHQQDRSGPSSADSRFGSPHLPNGGAGPSPSQLGLGHRPELDEAKISELLSLTTEMLSLLPLSALEGHLASLRTQTANTSALLAHLLQMREALQQDSETYNGIIAELVGEAQKIKMGKGRTASKRGSSASVQLH